MLWVNCRWTLLTDSSLCTKSDNSVITFGMSWLVFDNSGTPWGLLVGFALEWQSRSYIHYVREHDTCYILPLLEKLTATAVTLGSCQSPTLAAHNGLPSFHFVFPDNKSTHKKIIWTTFGQLFISWAATDLWGRLGSTTRLYWILPECSGIVHSVDHSSRIRTKGVARLISGLWVPQYSVLAERRCTNLTYLRTNLLWVQ